MRCDSFSGASTVSLEEMLDAREKRAAYQRELLAGYKASLICFTMNMPGAYKVFPLLEKAFGEGCGQILRALERSGSKVVFKRQVRERTGCEAFFSVERAAPELKRSALDIEEKHPLGRLFDIDVFAPDGSRLSGSEFGRPERECLVCGKPVWECARTRAHGPEELAMKAVRLMENYFSEKFAEEIARAAQRALLYEAAAAPKPGLVDGGNSGAHKDMDVFTFIDSACALVSYFKKCALEGLRFNRSDFDNDKDSRGPELLLRELRFYGLAAEEEMFRATGGANTHKGAIFSLGILAAAAGLLNAQGSPLSPENVSALCGLMAGETLSELPGLPGLPDLQGTSGATHGTGAYKKHGITGVRGEAASGFQSAVRFGLPALESALEGGASMNDACVTALLNLLAHVDDTNVIHRAGLEALRELQARVAGKLSGPADCGGLIAFARELDAELIQKNISPGGCADLLAVSLTLMFFKEIS